MNDVQQRLKDISEIRGLMERSARFLSLSGLSGIGTGIVAFLGAWASYTYLVSEGIWENWEKGSFIISQIQLLQLGGIALTILFSALLVAIFFSVRLARVKNLPIWGSPARYLLLNLSVPLVSGGGFCILLAYHNFVGMVAPATLIFYGLALHSASKYTLREVGYLGISEVVLGLIAACWVGNAWTILLFWTLGFGVLHILYGVFMYLKYER